MPNPRVTMKSLGYLGLIPFVVAFAMSTIGGSLFSFDGDTLFISYSTVILSFLSGVMWGRGLTSQASACAVMAMIISNVFALLAWASLLASADYADVSLTILGMGYVALYLAERNVNSEGQTIEGYPQLRQRLTLAVVVFHLLMLLI